MRLFGFDITRTRAAPVGEAKALTTISDYRSGWWPIIREPFSGAWQRNLEIRDDQVDAFYADFACRTLISSDISKLDLYLQEGDANDIWTNTTNPAYSPVLRKPNSIQTRIQFYENWMLSKLGTGNTFALKQRDGRGVVIALFVLDPHAVRVLVADDGSVFYQVNADNLSGIPAQVYVPAREIIHDRFNCVHPLIGVPPRYANRLAAQQGLNMQTQGAVLFQNHAVPGGLLTSPDNISQADGDRLKAQWEDMFSGPNRGRVAVLGNGTKYERLPFTAVEGQMIEQLRWTAEVVCSTYHVPGYMVGVGPMPTHNNIEALLAQYYSQCLQVHLEGIELCLKEGLGIAETMRVKFDLDGLLRMDTATQYKSIADGIRGGFLTPNEGRWKIDKKPIKGGDTVYMQEQDHSLQALAERDQRPDPFAKGAPAPAAKPPAEAPPANDNAMAREADAAVIAILKGLADVRR